MSYLTARVFGIVCCSICRRKSAAASPFDELPLLFLILLALPCTQCHNRGVSFGNDMSMFTALPCGVDEGLGAQRCG